MKQQKLVSSEKIKNDNEPELRFPEFNSKWNEVKLKDISDLTSSKRIYLSDYTDDGIPFYRGAEITLLKENKTIETDLYISKNKYDEIRNKFGVPKKDDILITGVGTLGNVYRIPNDNPFYFKDGNLIWLKNISQNSNFLELYLEYKKNDILKLAIGSTQKALTMQNLEKLRLNIPSLKEQEKISNFLKTINMKIKLLEREKIVFHSTKGSIIKTLYDNILINSDEELINDLFSIKKGKGLSKEKIDKNGQYSAILYGELYTTYNEIIESTISFTDYEEGFLSKKGDILIPGSTTTKGIDLVTASVVCEDNIQLGGDINILRKKQELNPVYVATFIKYCMKREILRLTQGSTIIHLYGKDLKDLSIKLPSLEVQNNIANFIKYYNAKEKLYDEEINKVKDFKKGLLQKMFI